MAGRKVTASLEVTAQVDKAVKTLKVLAKQIKGVEKLLDEGDKKGEARQKRLKKRLSAEVTARKRIKEAIRAEKIDRHVAKLEKEAIARGKLTNVISKQGRAAVRAAAQAAKAQERAAAQIKKAQDRAAAQAKKATAANKNQASSFSKIGKAAQKLFFIYETLVRIAKALKMVLVDPFVKAAKAASNFNLQLAEIDTLFDKSVKNSASRVALLGTHIKQLSIMYGQDLTKTAKAAYNAVSSGAVDAATAQSLLQNATKLSVGGLVGTEVAMKALTTVSNSFGRSLGKTEHVGDLLFTTVQKGVTTMGELAPKIGRVSGLAGATGMNMESMFAIIAAGTKVTGNTSRTVVGLSSAINLLLKPGKTAKDMLDAVNKRLVGFKIASGTAALTNGNMVKTLQNMAKAFKQGKVSADELAKIIPNQRAQGIVLGIVKEGAKELAEIYKTMSDAGIVAGAMQAANNKIFNTSTHQMKRYKVSVHGAQVALGNFYEKSGFTKGFFKGMGDELENIIRAFNASNEEVVDQSETWENWGRAVARAVAMAVIALKLVADVVLQVFATIETALTIAQEGFMVGFEKMFTGIPLLIKSVFKDVHVSILEGVRDMDFPGADKVRSIMGFKKSDLFFPILEMKDAEDALKEHRITMDAHTKWAEKRAKDLATAWGQVATRSLTALTHLMAGDLAQLELMFNKSIGLSKKVTGGTTGTTGAAGDDAGKLKGTDAKQASAMLAEQIANAQYWFREALHDASRTSLLSLGAQGMLGPETGALLFPLPELPMDEMAERLAEFRDFWTRMEGWKGGIVVPLTVEDTGVKGTVYHASVVDYWVSFFKRSATTLPSTTEGMKALNDKLVATAEILTKLRGKDLEKVLAGGLEGATKIVTAQLAAATKAEEIIQKGKKDIRKRNQARKIAQDKRDAARLKRDVKLEEKLQKKAQQAERKRLREIEQTAGAIASTVVGLGSTLIKDLVDKEKTAEEAFRNLGYSLLEMGATAVAEFLVREGVKQAMIALTSGLQTTAAAAEITASKLVTAQVVADQAKQAAAKLTASGVGGAGKVAGDVAGGAAGGAMGGLWGIAIMALIAVIGGLLAWLMDDDARKNREATKLEAFYIKEAKHYSHGGLVTGGVAGRDSVRAMLTPGEYVLNKSTVDSIRQGTLPRTPGHYASGGMVTAGGGTQIVFAPRIETIALPNSVQNMRYFRDTVAKTRGRLASLKG